MNKAQFLKLAKDFYLKKVRVRGDGVQETYYIHSVDVNAGVINVNFGSPIPEPYTYQDVEIVKISDHSEG